MSTNSHDDDLPDGPRDEEYEAAWREMWGGARHAKRQRIKHLTIAYALLLIPIGLHRWYMRRPGAWMYPIAILNIYFGEVYARNYSLSAPLEWWHISVFWLLLVGLVLGDFATMWRWERAPRNTFSAEVSHG